MVVNYSWDQKHAKFQRKQLQETSESNSPVFVVLLLTASLPNWRLHVLDPRDHNHIHCRFPSKKCALCIFCCCPGGKRERRDLMALTTTQRRGRWTHWSCSVLTASLSLCMVYMFGPWPFQVPSYHTHEAFFLMANTYDYKQLQSVTLYWFHVICKKSIHIYN